MYDVQMVLSNLDENLIFFLVFGGIGGICNWWLLIEGIRVGFRDRMHSISLICLLFWAAHDVSFVLLWDTFFRDIDHWVWKLFWFNILGSVITEIILFYQVLKFSGDELFPGIKQAHRLGILAGAFSVAMIVFWYLKSAFGGDPLFLYMMPLTILMCPMFSLPMALRRRSSQGQSTRQMLIYIILVLGIWPAWYILDEVFRQPLFIGMGVATILMSIFNIVVLKCLPEKEIKAL